ncbi:MAG: FxSxx-COOH system tetratricopeptide repeat protein [Solirubrobacteraceae bacterium]
MEPTDRSVEIVRVVVVSPGDVAAERKAVVSVVDGLNRRVAPANGCLLSLWRWETDARPGLHLEGPQGLIDERMEIADSDVVVGIFWKRFGTPTSDAQSGSEHELRKASEAWRQNGRPDVMVYFSTQPASPTTSTELEQWHRVVKFREELPKEQLWWSYTTPVEFERLVRGHLEDVVLRRTAREPHADAGSAGGTSVSKLWFGVPAVVAAFSGRGDEIGAVEEALGVAGSAVIAQAITGLGGVGKTQLAARYVQLHGSEYDIVAWIRAQDGGIADLADLAGKLGEPIEGLSPIERRDLALERLRRGDERWLLVLDNVESAATLYDCLPRAGNGRALVTSRNREVRQFAPVLSLDVFDPASAVGYLTERAQRPDDRAGAERLAPGLGYLPLALSHAAAYCAEGTSFDDYLELLDALPAQELFDSSPEVSYTQTITSTWKASIEAAGVSSPLANAVLALAAHLGPDAIPRLLFEVLIDPGVALERKRLGDALGALARFSLATVDDETVSVHRLLAKVVRDDARARVDPSAVEHALAALEHAFPADPSDASLWPRSERLLAHVIALADAAAEVVPKTAAQVIELLNRACTYLIWAEGGARGLALAQSTVKRATSVLGTEHPGTLTARNREGVTYRQTGRASEAIALLEPLLADCERILCAEHPNTLSTRNNLALAYQDAGRVGETLAIYEPLLADQERILGAEHPSTLRTRHNLALAYRDAGRVAEAIAILEPLLADQERILSAEHPSTLRTRHNLTRAYHDAGRVAEAIAILEPLLADRERILGAEHPDTLVSRHNLAGAYLDAGRVGEAIAILEPLLPDRERILGPEHPDTLATRNELAVAYRDAGRAEEAIAILQPLLAECERLLGAEHPTTLATRHNLAGAYQAAGRVVEAIAILTPLLAERERLLGPEHPRTLATRQALADAYRAAGS